MSMIIEQQELLARLPELIANHDDFEVWGYDTEGLFSVSSTIEQVIENQHLTCRIYTRGRLAAAAVGIVSLGAGLLTLAGIGIHNLMTYKPDYEVCRDLANGRILVEYKK